MMANFEATLQTLLGNLVSGRCYPLINNSTTIVCPYITFQEVHAAPYIMVDNSTDPEVKRIQIDVWAMTYTAARTLAGQVKAAMQGANFQNVPIMFQDLYEEVSKEFRVMLEYSVWP